MQFDARTTAAAFVVLLAVIVGSTLISPMQPDTVAVVSGGLIVFGVLTLVLGVKHGEYRAR